MKGWLIFFGVIAALCLGHAHYMAWAEEKCADLGNTPQECALLKSEVL